MHQCISNLNQRVSAGCAELSLRLFVLCGQVADETGFEEFSYEFFVQAFTIYEDSISDSKAQFQAVCIVASALHGTRGFGRENYDTLITKAALHGSKLLKKPDQCRAVYLASHLWWVTENPENEGDEPKSVSSLPLSVLHLLKAQLTFPMAFRFIATAKESSNVSNVLSALLMPVWIRRCQWSCSSKFLTVTSTSSTNRMRL